LVIVKCEICGEEIKVLVDPEYEVERTYREDVPYILRKEIIGEKCPNLIRVEIGFDANWKILWKESVGGTIEEIREVSL